MGSINSKTKELKQTYSDGTVDKNDIEIKTSCRGKNEETGTFISCQILEQEHAIPTLFLIDTTNQSSDGDNLIICADVISKEETEDDAIEDTEDMKESISSYDETPNNAFIHCTDSLELYGNEDTANVPPFSTELFPTVSVSTDFNDDDINSSKCYPEEDTISDEKHKKGTKIEENCRYNTAISTETPVGSKESCTSVTSEVENEKENNSLLKITFDESLIYRILDTYRNQVRKDLRASQPTPEVLVLSQNSIGVSNEVPRTEEGIPLPVPYKWSRQVDDKTVGTKISSSMPLSLLLQRLRHESKPYEKLRIIFKVVTSFNKIELTGEHMESVGIKIADDNCDIHVVTFQRLCSLVDIPCVIVDGYTKTVFSEGKYNQSLVNQWAAVLHDERWMLVDPHPLDRQAWQSVNCLTFGSSNKKTNSFEYLFDKQTQRQFLVNPTEFVYFFYPSKAYWQLLCRPVSRDEWNDMTYVTPFFYEFKLGLKGAYAFCIDMTEQNFTIFKISFPKIKKLQFAAKFCSLKGECLDRDRKSWTFVETDTDQGLSYIKINTIHSGLLKIYALDIDVCTVYVMVCCFLIKTKERECNSNEDQNIGFPRNILRLEWGPGNDTAICGLVPLSHKTSQIYTEENSVLIKFERTKDDYSYDFKIEHAADIEEAISRRFVFLWYEPDTISFRISNPLKGIVMFNVLKKETVFSSHDASVCSYLIHFQNEPSCNCMPPYVEEGRLGITRYGRKEKLICTGCVNGIIECPSSGEVTLRLQCFSDIHIKPRLHLMTSCFHNMIRHVFVTHHNNLIIIRLNLPRRGDFLLSLYSSADHIESKCLYNGLISVSRPSLRWSPYPELCLDHHYNIGVFSPKSGILAARTDIYFSVEVENSVDVAAVSCKGWSHLDQTSDNIWEGLVTTGYAGTEVRMMARFEMGSDEFHKLLTYKVISAAEIETKNKHQQLLVKRPDHVTSNVEYEELKTLLKYD